MSAVARRQGRTLEGVAIQVLGGATKVEAQVSRYRALNDRTAMVGLCDANEAPLFHGCEGLDEVEVCDANLEDELLRAVGLDRMVDFISSQGELAAFETFQKQPPWRDRPLQPQLMRFWGTRARRKTRYAEELVSWISDERMPTPLVRVLDAAETRR